MKMQEESDRNTKIIKEFISKPMFNKNIYNHKNNNYPRISIVMPSYNQGEFIERSILSVLNQNYPNTELIIIDGGSTDNTVNIIKKYEKYISYWLSENDRGQSNALNKGFKQATGDIFGWLNSDDLYYPNSFYIVIEYFKKHLRKNIIIGDYLIVDTNDENAKLIYALDFNINHFIYEGSICNAQSCFWRKKVHKKFGLFDENLHRTMDSDMLLRFGIVEGNNKFGRIESPIACFRRHSKQKTQEYDKIANDEHIRIASKYNLNKFSNTLYFKRWIYRLRRIYLYYKRGGISYLLNKMTFNSIFPRFKYYYYLIKTTLFIS